MEPTQRNTIVLFMGKLFVSNIHYLVLKSYYSYPSPSPSPVALYSSRDSRLGVYKVFDVKSSQQSSVVGSSSLRNIQEAKFAVKLVQYLLNNNTNYEVRLE